jgi:hypothetical protein
LTIFELFINDIADDMLGLGRLFGDDTSIGHTAHDENTLKNMIIIDLKYIQKWSKRWLVKFNSRKTDIMVFSANNQQNDLLFDFNSTLSKTVGGDSRTNHASIPGRTNKMTKSNYLSF